MPSGLRQRLSGEIATHLFAWERYRDAGTVHCFASIERNAEVDTAMIIRRMLEEGKRVCLPRAKGEPGQMESVLLNSLDDLQPGRYGIAEPAGAETVASWELDLILVPMIAADRKYHRLGYGQGYYDRFLASASGCRAGLLFREFLLDGELPVDAHDVRLDVLITESGVMQPSEDGA